MRSVQKRLRDAKGFDKFMKGFAFNTLAQVKDNIAQGWVYADQQPAYIFSDE